MEYIYAYFASFIVALHLFSLKLLSEYETYYYEILLFMFVTLVISRILIYYAMRETNNPSNVHLILNLSVFVTLLLTGIFLKLDNIDLSHYIIGVIFILIGLYFIRES